MTLRVPKVRRLLASLAVAASCGLACTERAPTAQQGRGVLVIAIDGLRADHVGLYGYDRDTTPALDQLARGAVVFNHAFSSAPWALPAHAALLTGCDPNVARRLLPAGAPETLLTVWNVPSAAPRAAHEFLRQGYRTAGFFEHPRLTPVHGLDPGFEFFREGGSTERGAGAVVQEFQNWLRGLDRKQNWFAYLQVEDLGRIWRSVDLKWDKYFPVRPELDWVPPIGMADHPFFSIPRQHWTGGLETLGEYEAEYDGAIRRIDAELGRMFKRLVRERRFQRTTIVVVGTHGMGFGEAGLLLDHGTLSSIDLHVPLIVRPADRGLPGVGGWARGERVDAVASLVDVAPTVLDLLGLDLPRAMQGVSQEVLCRDPGAVAPRRFAFASCGRQEGYAVLTERWTFEARMPWSEHRGLSRSWYGDEERHVGDYCERLQDRELPFDPLCEPGPFKRPVAEELRMAAREEFERSHQLRLLLQESDWGVEPSDVEMVPQMALWKPERFR